jgi:hypothetical protein
VDEICRRDFMCDKLPYCLPAAGTASSLAGGQQSCIYSDHNTVTWPPSEKNSLTLATRMTYYSQTLKKGGANGTACAPTGDALPQTAWDCQYEPSVSSGDGKSAYVADIGNFTMQLSHTMSAIWLPISATGMEMKGYLMRCKEGQPCAYENFERYKEFIPNALNHGTVEMAVRELLHATVPMDRTGVSADVAGLDLDATSDACPTRCVDKATGKHVLNSLRWMGSVMLVEIQYDNTGLLIPESSADNIMFNMYVWPIKGSVFHIEVPFVQQGHAREIHSMHGLRFVTMIKGKLGLFSWATLMLQLSTSVAMIFVSTTIVDMILTKLMTNREYYKFVKYADAEESFAALEGYLRDREDLSSEEKEKRIKTILALKADAGVDWTLLTSCGGSSAAPDVDPNIFRQQVTTKGVLSPTETKDEDIEEANETTPIVGVGPGSGTGNGASFADAASQRPGGQGSCCVIS